MRPPPPPGRGVLFFLRIWPQTFAPPLGTVVDSGRQNLNFISLYAALSLENTIIHLKSVFNYDDDARTE